MTSKAIATEGSNTLSSADEMKLVAIPSSAIATVWPMVMTLIKNACARSNGRFDEASIRRECMASTQQLWIVWQSEKASVRAVAVTQIIVYPSGLKVLDIVIVTGEGRKDWSHLVTELEHWGRENGCGLVQLLARKGWARELTAYRMSHVLLERKLDE